MQGRPTALTEHIIMDRVRTLFHCQRVVTAREQHDPTALGGYHYHIAIHCSDASKNTAIRRRIRQAPRKPPVAVAD